MEFFEQFLGFSRVVSEITFYDPFDCHIIPLSVPFVISCPDFPDSRRTPLKEIPGGTTR